MCLLRSPAMDLEHRDDLISHDFLELQAVILQILNPFLQFLLVLDGIDADPLAALPVAVYRHLFFRLNLEGSHICDGLGEEFHLSLSLVQRRG